MSWKFGGLVIKKDFSKNLQTFFDVLERSQKFSGSIISFNESLNVKANQSAVAGINQATVLFNEYLPYDCSFTPGKETSFDKKLAEVSKQVPVLVFFLDGSSGTYGFSVFERGERKRQWAATDQSILCNEGEFLDVESSFIAGTENAQGYDSLHEARVIKIFEDVVEADFSILIKNKDLKFLVFV